MHNTELSNRDIGRRLGRAHQTNATELKRGATTQLKRAAHPIQPTSLKLDRLLRTKTAQL
ncbi:helix-turn-helix domain-containing protein [Sporosarcina sp. P1]|uniref:helix-turn-helix domain-containing protein n=1 Tax=unclassified Sporosarcina TaxID=2647733 RepID=UPI00350F43CE